MLPTAKFKVHTRSDFPDAAGFIVSAKETDAVKREKAQKGAFQEHCQKHLITHKVERGQL